MLDRKTVILSAGSYVPDTIVTNSELARLVDTTDEWITSRTGIRQRRIVPRDSDMSAAEMGARAADAAIGRAGVAPHDIDAILCATFTPDHFFPSNACRMQHVLGCTKAFAFDLSAACAGFVYGLTLADSLIRSGQCRTVLLVGTELISRTLDWTDRTTCILFGDGAGAVVLQAAPDSDRGVLSACLASDGSLGDILKLPAFGDHRSMFMKGNEVYKNAVRLMGDISVDACAKAGVRLEELDLLIPHQANIRIIQGLTERLSFPIKKTVTNMDRFGNTSAASIPLALDEAWREGRIKSGTTVLFTALGGGIAYGAAVVRF